MLLRAIIVISFIQLVSSKVYKDIDVKGLQRLDKAYVIYNCGLKIGIDYNQQSLNKALKALYATGNFTKVQLKEKSLKLIIEIVENPMINKIVYEGNKAVGNKVLDEFLQLKPRQIYSLALLKADIQKMRAIYRNHGYFTPRIVPKIIKLSHNRVNLVYEIKQGKRAKVTKIEFMGNKNFDNTQLQKVIMTKEYKFYKKFLGVPSTYDPDRLEYDKELLRNYYLNHGFLDFKAYSAIAQLSSDEGFFILTFMLEEGIRFAIENVVIKNNIRGLDLKDIKGEINLAKGDYFSQQKIENLEYKLTTTIAQKGFVGVAIKINHEKNGDKVIITININQRAKQYIDKIHIEGNNKTRDYVLRRIMGLKEGDPYNNYRIHQAKRRLYNLGYFKSVNIDQENKDNSDLLDLIVKLEETSQGQIFFSSELSADKGSKINLMFMQENLYGTGRSFGAKLEFAPESIKFWKPKSLEFSVNFFDQYFFGLDNLGFGLEFDAGFYKESINDKTAKDRLASLIKSNSKIIEYNHKFYDIGLIPRISYRLNDNLRQTWKLWLGVEGIKYSLDSIKELSPKIYDTLHEKYKNQSKRERYITLDALKGRQVPYLEKPRHSTFKLPDIDHYKKLSMGHYIVYDRLDNTVLPNNGFEFALATDLIHLLPSNRNNITYIRNILTLSWYKELKKNLVLSCVGSFGALLPLFNTKLRLQDHFHLGDNSLRGYALKGIGPRDSSTAENYGKGTALGGKYYYKSTIELRYPAPKIPEEFQTKLHGFIDMGAIVTNPIKDRFTNFRNDNNYDFQFNYSDVKYNNAPRFGAGVGISFKLPSIGNIRLDFARALNPKDEDVKTSFHMSTGTRF